ncbi:MAG: transcription elongation factor GreB [Chromatiales bacterium]|jgi:transcription elongation factor GreB|nr:transcription elongation factor GreB [Chromatiales bacterium]
MGRYRAPEPKSSPYITADGFRALRDENDELWTRRRDVVKHLTAAAAEGDRSENAEYIYRKKQLREIDRRIGYLQRRLPNLKVVERPPGTAPSQVFFGATVVVLDEEGEESTYRVVGSDELNPSKNWISVDSPLSRALLKHRVDDEVAVTTPNGPKVFTVCDISY